MTDAEDKAAGGHNPSPRKGLGDKKAEPDDLALHARPRPVTRLSRKALIGISVIGSALIFGAMLYALDPPSFLGRGERQELYNVVNKPTAEGLESLPRSYQDIPPKLGPPLPGDLGAAVLKSEQEAGIEDPGTMPAGVIPFRPDARTDAERAERLRRARQAQKAREAAVFFQLSQRATAGPRGQETSTGGVGSLESAALSGQQGPGNGTEASVPQTQGLQARKIAFLNQQPDDQMYNPYPLTDPVSPFQVMAGTVIAASMITGINSDLPGMVIAQVTENVYDTVTGRHLLIPQGSRLIGRYDSVIAFGQERALVVWHRFIMPDGSSIVVDNLPATDTAGYAGLEDEVDFHTWRLVKGIALATLLGIGTELTFGGAGNDLVSAIRESTQDTGNQVGQRFVERMLDVQPTITVRPGWPLRVIVSKDFVLRPYEG